MKDRYINPFTDFGFKKLFCEPNKELVHDFLSSILYEKYHIQNFSYINNELQLRPMADRKSVVDLSFQSENKDSLIVEIRKAKHNFYKNRDLFKKSFPIVRQTGQISYSHMFSNVKIIYAIAILDYSYNDEDRDKTISVCIEPLNTTQNSNICNKLVSIHLQLPNFTKTESELNNHLDKWLFVLKNLHKLHNRPEQLQEPVFEKLFDIAEISKIMPDEIQEYEESLKIYRDLKNSFDTAREEGKNEQKKEYKASVAENMIRIGESDEKIVLYTELSLELVKELRKKLEESSSP